ncbi:ribosome recycling factor [Candidatus Kaiserbacteria bacterium]|nr:ribosome recycling factor [Candidatus Kaiserbacteria bacterium]
MAYDFSKLDKKLLEIKEWLSREYQSLRTGRAAPALLDAVHVDAYGSRMPLKQVANIGIEGARSLVVTPFDPSLLKDIERGVVSANLGVGSAVSGNFIRITFPELTGERRQALVKGAKSKLEEARVALRSARDEHWSAIQMSEREGTMTEDEKFRLKDELQKKMDTANDALEALFDKKEKEVTE